MKCENPIRRMIRLAAILVASVSMTKSIFAASDAPIYADANQPLEKRVQDLISRLTLEEKAMLLNHRGTTVERFNIRADQWNQCLHGVCWADRPTTMFPVSIAMAATWDPALVHEVATAISDEARGIYNLWHQQPGPGQGEEGPDLSRPGDQHRAAIPIGAAMKRPMAKIRS